MADAYEALALPAGKKAVFAIAIAQPAEEPPAGAAAAGAAATAPPPKVVVEWDWAVEAYDVEWSVRFTPAAAGARGGGGGNGGGGSGGAAPGGYDVVATTRHAASSGPAEGRFELPEGCAAGVLELTLSNGYSMLRSKSLTWKLVTPKGVAAPKPVVS